MARISIDHRPERDLTVLVMEGAVSASDIVAALARFYELGPTRDLIWDIAGADVTGVASDELRGVMDEARQLAPTRPGGRTAIVAPSDLAFGLSRMYEILADASGHHAITHAVVRSREDAHAWLDAGA